MKAEEIYEPVGSMSQSVPSPFFVHPSSFIIHPSLSWRRRVGIEPT